MSGVPADPVTEDYLRRCAGGDRGLLDAMAAARLPAALTASMRGRFLPRPMFVPDTEILGFAERINALFDLIVSVPDRFFDGDRERYAAAVGLDGRRAAYLARFTDRPQRYGRADLYHDGSAFRLLEFNVGSALGGMDRAQISAALLQVPAFKEFAAEHRLDFVDTGARVDRALRAAARPVCGDRAPVVAFVDGNGAMAPYLHLATSFQEMLAGFGVEVLLGELADVGFAAGRVTLHGRAVDLVLRYFGVGDFLDDPAGRRTVDALVDADADGTVVLYTSLAGELYNNKTSLALLAELAGRGELTPAETGLVDSVLPWTRTVTSDLFGECAARRGELMLKPGADFGGTGIVAGWLVDDDQWRRALRLAADHGSIVQRRVVPRGEPVIDPSTGQRRDWHAVWDCFLTPEGYAGSHIRALPAGEGAVIGMGVTAAARTTGIFYHPVAADHPRRPATPDRTMPSFGR
ncbi:hypothetical protein [Micromonospora yangpuensis]|uniref:Glutathionylspermidine synthase preATP-grasp n=1 Tax=Micromonospora yangpuensis TaxID=683228 RepID=A0A1C6V3E8_9ACTN|nr:hypothetical protein [Micromonospora yangpuensis]GGM15125.1 hypothetical protein GCM10012279_36610 [Micromonospora yangpuensis]SCL60892.1 hypothetical protein GA0070617_4506 [Micromonospora yangpuensis]